MSDQTVDFGNGQSMVFRKYVPERIKPRTLRDLPSGISVRFTTDVGVTKERYTSVRIGELAGYIEDGKHQVEKCENNYPWWHAESDVNPDGTIKFVDGGDQRTYGSLVAGDVFENRGYTYVLRSFHEVGIKPVYLGIGPAYFNHPLEPKRTDIVKYLGHFEFSR